MAIRLRAAAAAVVTATGDWTDTPTIGTIWIGAHWLDEATITPVLTETLENGESFRVVDEGAPLDLTLTGAGEAALNAIIAAGLDEVNATVRLHNGATGADHTGNELTAASNPGYAPIALTLESAVV